MTRDALPLPEQRPTATVGDLFPTYVEREVSLATDPLTTAVALSAASLEPYLLYEHGGGVTWVEGEAGVAEIGPGGPSVTVAGERVQVTDGIAPLAAVGRVLDAMGLPAYGWATYELSWLLHDTRPVTGPVLRLALPRREARFLEGGVVRLRAESSRALDALVDQLTAASTVMPAHHDERVAADLDQYGADDYRKAVAAAIDDIQAGLLEKVIVSRRVPVWEAVDLPASYLVGRRANDPARSFLLRSGGWEAAGFSPEIVTQVTADGTVHAQPLAGTRALNGDRTADLARRAELYRDAKEVYEHAVSVRTAAEELAHACSPGSVRIDDFMSVSDRGSVQHLASHLTGRLAGGKTRWDALAALFPAVTASGIPKRRACDWIDEVEPTERGLYSGAVIAADGEGALDAALVLRSVYRRDGQTWLRAGAGVVAQSDPERELEETREKLRSVGRHLMPQSSPEHPGR
ncbi:salicylate synthase [Streptomyces sp. MP131-18]|uniref:salicylate synthase n=1 Tax=Streptomyces sp. MP131-18 TaxID=1857892 RepID=UPI0009A2485A|nr:salicylate synthase [Streptomyces sp. MP131-18]ONK09524.1 Isochorismate synthase/isochorismate-pyruvate lyase MbtI [Streptomyces sp. MP131-18]